MYTVILAGTEHPGNLGAVARTMMNFGVEQLLLLEPQCDPASTEATTRAKHASAILYHARTITRDDLKEFDLVVGTTAKLGNDFNLPRTPLFPWQLSERLASREGSIALLFGPERAGLDNELLRVCDVTVTIPTSAAYPSLNLSHAVAIILYELHAKPLAHAVADQFPLVKAEQKAQIKRYIEEILDRYDFTVESRLETQRLLWQRLVGKSALTQREAMALLGFLRKIAERR